MGFWEQSVRIFNYLCEAGTQSVRHIAQHTGLSKSSAHRLTQAIVRRDIHPESWMWETAEGRRWLTRLVVATLYTFGLKRGVGLDTMSEFFSHLHLETQVGSSPGALRGVLQTLAQAILEIGQAWEQDAVAAGEVPEIIGAVDETFLERLLLVFLDLPTGYLLLEDLVESGRVDVVEDGRECLEKLLFLLAAGRIRGVLDRRRRLGLGGCLPRGIV